MRQRKKTDDDDGDDDDKIKISEEADAWKCG